MNQPIADRTLARGAELPTSLEEALDPSTSAWNLRQGTVRSPEDRRIVFLSTDMVRGIRQALEWETGEATELILRTCGRRWGGRTARALEATVEERTGKPPGELSLDAYLTLLEEFVARAGWGLFSVDLAHAESHGVLVARLENSFFEAAFPEAEGRIDTLFAGLLEALFSRIAGQELGAVQLDPSGTEGGPRFLISGAARIDDAAEQLEDGEPAARVLARLLGGA